VSTKFKAAVSGDVLNLEIYDDIGPDWLGMVSAETIAPKLNSFTGKTIRVFINSPGGDVDQSLAIYNLLLAHPALVEVYIIGLAASGASIIAMAGDVIYIAAAAALMVHNAWTTVSGSADELRKTASVLDGVNKLLKKIYSARTGIPEWKLAQLLDAETWYFGQEAVDAGFVDGISQKFATNSAKIAANRYRNTPAALIDGTTSFPKREDADARIERIVSGLNAPPNVAKAERRINKLLTSIGS
jgi:ATP-dependent Clp protease, protease subunit